MPGAARMALAKKRKIEQYAVVGLVLIFSGLLFRSLKRPAVARPPVLVSQAVTKTVGLLPELMKQRMEQFNPKQMALPGERAGSPAASIGYTAQELRDPFKDLLPQVERKKAQAAPGSRGQTATSAVAKPPVLPKLVVTGLWWGSAPKALINGTVCRVGDRVEGAAVTAITRAGVTVEFAGRTLLLTTDVAHAAGAAQAAYPRR